MIQFILNDKTIQTQLSKGSTVLDFVRYEKQLVGTKVGCREGDCGACTILIGELKNGKLVYQSMTSCITPLINIHGKHVLTIEGINGDNLTPIQALMVNNNGTQCGFCTPGFIVSLTGFALSDKMVDSENAIKSIDGNICRCTGYKSIERATDDFCDQLKNKPTTNKISWLVENNHLPNYMTDIESRLVDLNKKLTTEVISNNTFTEYFLGGGTDLLVQKPEVVKKASVKNKFDNPDLKRIEVNNGICKIGASATVTDLEESPVFNNIFPNLKKHLKLVSSTPIRNMATLAGNFVNASPIGDMTIFFLALDSSIILNTGEKKRTLPLKELYLDYKKLDKSSAEFIESIQFSVPNKSTHFNFEKVSKRTHLDIASVNSACQINLNTDNTISEIHLSAGGVGPIPKYLLESCSFLKNKKLNSEILNDFFKIVTQEISPISDARGTADYKRLLLRQLILAHFIEFFGAIEPITKMLKG
ncbi:MAG: FAD binding domain-containing protein [Saprospiraceae bacterium]